MITQIHMQNLYGSYHTTENLMMLQARVVGFSKDPHDPSIRCVHLSDFSSDRVCRLKDDREDTEYKINDPVNVMLKLDHQTGLPPVVLCSDRLPDRHLNVELIPRCMAAHPSDVVKLVWLVNQVKQPRIRRLIDLVLSDPEIFPNYIQAPASLKHHHHEAGGLLRHSLEVAQIVRTELVGNPYLQDLGTAAALFHDIGKIKTLAPGMRTETGRLVDHEALNLEVLAPWIKLLEKHDSKLANKLRNLLGTRHPKSHYPESIVGRALKCADKLSVAKDLGRSSYS